MSWSTDRNGEGWFEKEGEASEGRSVSSQAPGRVTTVERGWAAHFCAAHRCQFRRNTLLECGEKRVVVSTIGGWHRDGGTEKIGCNRYFETMAFEAQWEEPYWEANISKQTDFNSNWQLDHWDRNSDAAANDMHEAVVAEISERLCHADDSEATTNTKGETS